MGKTPVEFKNKKQIADAANTPSLVTGLKQQQLEHDGPVLLAIGNSRKEMNWKNREMDWSDLVKKLSETTRTKETVEEYRKLPKDVQDRIKDIGGFVGGKLNGGRRKAGSIDLRHLLTLDFDNCKPGIIEAIGAALNGIAYVIYSTHKHTPENPRLRLVMPFRRPVTRDEYEPIGRRIAEQIDIEQVDCTTYEPERLMYWPSSSKDSEYLYRYSDAPWLDPDSVLASLEDWRDPSCWPKSSADHPVRHKAIKEQGDPLTKPEPIGAFCRAYSMQDVIDKFLAGVYGETASPNRYTYLQGSTASGAVIYEDKWFYSHHNTDPAGGRLLNAFDLVRLHKFGNLDEGVAVGTPINKMPSYKAMCRMAVDDESTRLELTRTSDNQIAQDFYNLDAHGANDSSWLKLLDMTDKGQVKPTLKNIALIIENDPKLKGCLRYNEFSNRNEITGSLPWREVISGQTLVWADADDAQLRHYLDVTYGINHVSRTTDAINIVFDRHKYHPVKEYLRALKWDGQQRMETLLIDFLGADDTQYVRAVVRKTLIAAVSRVMEPGCKFDNMLVLSGPQGIGKSSILRKIFGPSWFSDSLTCMEGKEAYEQLLGKWCLEIGELNAARRSEAEAIKLFLSKQADNFRPAYGRRTVDYLRQCIFIGTTNSDMFLRDATGNRRFWPVKVGHVPPKKGTWDKITQDYIDQIWAEAAFWYDFIGEELYLDTPELQLAANAHQDEFKQDNVRAGMVEDFLEEMVPENWNAMNQQQRRNYLNGQADDIVAKGTKKRTRICVVELLAECFHMDSSNAKASEINEMHDIMSNMPGWKKAEDKLRSGPYGPQRVYERIGPA